MMTPRNTLIQPLVARDQPQSGGFPWNHWKEVVELSNLATGGDGIEHSI
jgi:hypothetical protein